MQGAAGVDLSRQAVDLSRQAVDPLGLRVGENIDSQTRKVWATRAAELPPT